MGLGVDLFRILGWALVHQGCRRHDGWLSPPTHSYKRKKQTPSFVLLCLILCLCISNSCGSCQPCDLYSQIKLHARLRIVHLNSEERSP